MFYRELAMNSKEQILQEMTSVPEPILAEVLDFLRFLKSQRLQSSPSGYNCFARRGVQSCFRIIEAGDT